jgi:hypothetical protein
MNIWTEIYEEMADIIQHKDDFIAAIPDEFEDIRRKLEEVPEVEHIDLWHEQVSFLDEEHPFPSPAIFIEFNTLGVEDDGALTQRFRTQIDLHVFYETFADTYTGAVMQESAINFLSMLTLYGMMFHGRNGEHFGTMQRTGFTREDSGGAGNLYRISFECEIVDYTAMALRSTTSMTDREVTVGEGDRPADEPDDNPLYLL